VFLLISHFLDKIISIHQQLVSLANQYCSSPFSVSTNFHFILLSSFALPSEQEILAHLKTTSSTCLLDPIPTISYSLSHSSNIVTSSYKKAALTSILKKPDADPNNLDNNLEQSQIFLLFPKFLKKQLLTLVTITYMSVFSQGFFLHSAENALVRVTNVLLMAGLIYSCFAWFECKLTPFLLTNILLKRLSTIGITGIPFARFT